MFYSFPPVLDFVSCSYLYTLHISTFLQPKACHLFLSLFRTRSFFLKDWGERVKLRLGMNRVEHSQIKCPVSCFPVDEQRKVLTDMIQSLLTLPCSVLLTQLVWVDTHSPILIPFQVFAHLLLPPWNLLWFLIITDHEPIPECSQSSFLPFSPSHTCILLIYLLPVSLSYWIVNSVQQRVYVCLTSALPQFLERKLTKVYAIKPFVNV